MDDLVTNLEKTILKGYGNTMSLEVLLKIFGFKPSGVKKAEAVAILHHIYSDANNAAKLFQQLTDYEKALMTCIVQSNYCPLHEELKEIAKKYEFDVRTNSSGFREAFVPKDGYLRAFYVKDQIPDAFKAYLETVIPRYVRTFHPSIIKDTEEYAEIIGRHGRYKDFDMLLSFINNNKVPATKVGGYMNKTSLLKFHKIAGYDEICNNEIKEIENIRNAGDTIISFGMIMLLRSADIIDIVQEKFVFSKATSHFVGLSMPEKAKFLFEKYMRRGNRIMDECSRIFSSKLKFSRSVYDLSGPRSQIISYLKECPVNEWIDFDTFSKEIQKDQRLLFQSVVGDALIRDDYYNQYYNSPSWKEFEHCAISVVLMEYLAVLGAVDILAKNVTHSYDYYYAYETAYFRVTDLGAYLFGMTDSYQEKEVANVPGDKKGFIVQPNFDVVIANSQDRMQHELFFDRFAEKTVDDKEVSVYKLDFFGIAKALTIGLMIHEISSYCEAFSNVPLPDNVKSAFSEWEVQSKRIRIRNVTVIETDDHLLLEEISHYKGMKALSEGGVSSVLVLTPGSEKRAKGLIEKNKRFCVLEG
ncbi:MAG: helicase-associated domain-containing protein [Synergistaceae bacterium]|nr:helicase-associated domain-containing protein [Synergistaceae bacterium]